MCSLSRTGLPRPEHLALAGRGFLQVATALSSRVRHRPGRAQALVDAKHDPDKSPLILSSPRGEKGRTNFCRGPFGRPLLPLGREAE